MDPVEKEIRLLADARDRLYYLGAPSPICDDLDELIDQKIEAEMERIENLSEEELIAECAARGEDYHQVAAQFRAALLAAFDAATNSDSPMGKAYHRPPPCPLAAIDPEKMCDFLDAASAAVNSGDTP